MRIVFFGTPELAVPSLAALTARHEVTAVVCQPDKPKGRGKKLQPPPVKEWAEAQGIPVHQPAKLNDGSFEEWLRGQAPDVCALAAYGRILKQPILDVPRHGFINMHPSLLPKYRGPSPIQSAILNGDSVTGVTVMDITLEMDSGDIYLQREVPIGPDETAAELTARLSDLGGAMMAEVADALEAGTASRTPQDGEAATYCQLLSKEDGFLDWSAPARQIHNLVRGAQPWPAAQCQFEGAVCKILRSTVVPGEADAAPGTITAVEKDRVLVATGEGLLAILVFQPPGKRAMPMRDYLAGHALAPGIRFDSMSVS
jgi:methionyl-tRNA formyltransferase